MTTGEYDREHEGISELEAELTRSVYLNEADRAILTGALSLGDAVLLEGTPGTGKTTIAKTAAAAIGGEYGRIQGAPDLIPGDITGVEIWNPATQSFEFRKGPLFSNVVLADEINRMSPKAQAALLQGMQEREVTVGNTTHSLPQPFQVIATQNPNEVGQGTYPLTKANLDRFAVGIELPDLDERGMLVVDSLRHTPEKVLADTKELVRIGEAIVRVAVDPDMKSKIARIVIALRKIDKVNLDQSVLGGARPMQHITRQAQALAFQEKEHVVRARDIEMAAPYVLGHRTELTYNAQDKGINPRELISHAIRQARQAV